VDALKYLQKRVYNTLRINRKTSQVQTSKKGATGSEGVQRKGEDKKSRGSED